VYRAEAKKERAEFGAFFQSAGPGALLDKKLARFSNPARGITMSSSLWFIFSVINWRFATN
jgi:hypothetical protein